MSDEHHFVIGADLARDLLALGIAKGDIVMVHAAVSKIGIILGGPDVLIAALREVIGPEGTIMAYADWDASYEALLNADGSIPERWRERIPPFDPATSRATRDHGVFPEFLRTTPRALRSQNPGASVVALGGRADWLIEHHPIDYGYGEATPFAKLVEARGKVLMIGAPLDTMTLIHHAEHLADIANKRIKRVEVPFVSPSGTQWHWVEEFDTGASVAPQLDGEDYFSASVEAFLAGGNGDTGKLGAADCVVVEAAEFVPFAVNWIERKGR